MCAMPCPAVADVGAAGCGGADVGCQLYRGRAAAEFAGRCGRGQHVGDPHVGAQRVRLAGSFALLLCGKPDCIWPCVCVLCVSWAGCTGWRLHGWRPHACGWACCAWGHCPSVKRPWSAMRSCGKNLQVPFKPTTAVAMMMMKRAMRQKRMAVPLLSVRPRVAGVGPAWTGPGRPGATGGRAPTGPL